MVTGLVGLAFSGMTHAYGNNICKRTAYNLQAACGNDIRDDYFTQRGVCLNLEDNADRRECFKEASTTRREGYHECRDVRRARLDLCKEIGGDAYDPEFGEEFVDNFVDPLEIGGAVTPNPYFPLVPGNEWTYQSSFLDDEGELVTETIRVTVTSKTKLIEGVTCLVVNDVVDEDGSVIEDTDDWYAQDLEGNVWYCGEIALNSELFDGDDPEEAEITDIDGSWKSGRDGALAGISMPAAPAVGDYIRQEVAWREAEDVIEILSINGTEAAIGGSCTGDCLVTRDFTPLEPGVNETKYYAPGIGLILELDADGNRVELIGFNTP